MSYFASYSRDSTMLGISANTEAPKPKSETERPRISSLAHELASVSWSRTGGAGCIVGFCSVRFV